MVSSNALDELIFWKENVRVLNESTFTSSLVMEKSIFVTPVELVLGDM